MEDLIGQVIFFGISGLIGGLGTFAATIMTVSKKLNSTDQKLDEVKQGTAENKDFLGGFAEKLTASLERQVRQEEHISGLQAEVTKLQSKLYEREQESNRQRQTYLDETNRLSAKHDELREQLRHAQSEVVASREASLKERIALETKVDALSRKVDELSSQVVEERQARQAAQADAAEKDATITRLQAENKELREQVAMLRAQVAILTDKQLENRVNDGQVAEGTVGQPEGATAERAGADNAAGASSQQNDDQPGQPRKKDSTQTPSS